MYLRCLNLVSGSKRLVFVSSMVALLAMGRCLPPAAKAAPLDVRVASPGDGLISLGIYDARGRLVRSLAAADQATPGERHFA